MNKLLHTSNGLNNLEKFYGKPVIYVEGKDDIIFWNSFFSAITDRNLQIKPAGGVEELKEYIKMVVNNDSNIIIASDSHYDVIFDNVTDHPRIIYTFGHSIENTMYCPNNIDKLIEKRCRLCKMPTSIGQNWADEFFDSLYDFLLYDMANEYYNKSLTIMGDSCHKYLDKKNSPYLSKEKIDDKIDLCEKHFDDRDIERIKCLIEKSEKPIFKIIRGKFFTIAILNLIKQQIKKNGSEKTTLTIQHLFDTTVDGCHSCTIKCDEFKIMNKSCEIAIQSLN